ncbi:MAG: hypothetical protein M1480_12260 [Bacteroidetes bacterium]|nr:hypothetical protein [Bacteroidota bacterium]
MKLHLIKNYESNKLQNKLFLDDFLKVQRLPYASLLEDNEFNVIKAAKNGFHIISVAFIGLTNFSAVCQYGFGIEQPEQERFITPINTKKETGTLFPKYKLTILPYRYKTSAFMNVDKYDYTNGKGFTRDEVMVHIKDAIIAETDYIKSGKLVFDFRDLGEDMLRYRNLLHLFLTEDYKDYDWEVFMYSFDNSEWKI